MRFKLGTLQYLVLVEVKNRTRKTEASDMDAFVTKARDQNANKAVFVTAAGFQEGALTVAKRHGVDVFTVSFDETAPTMPGSASWIIWKKQTDIVDVTPALGLGELRLINNIEKIVLLYDDNKEYEIPDEQSQMRYYCNKIKFPDGRTLFDVIQMNLMSNVDLDKRITEVIDINPHQYITTPDNYFIPSGSVKAIKCLIVGRRGRAIRGNIAVDPNVITLPVVYTNAVTGETTRFTLDRIPLGFEPILAGRFYFQPHPLMYYYCASVQGETVHWHLIESFQNGQLVNATITQNIAYSMYYIPVTDKHTIERLKKRLSDYLRKTAK